MKLSNSSLNRYVDCPRSYQLHYIEKIRPIEIKSSLFYGSCIDQAFTEMLTPSDPDGRTPEEIFKAALTLQAINPNVKYSKADLDMELISPEMQEKFKDDVQALSWLSLEAKGLLMIKALREKVLPKIKKVHSTQEPVSLGNSDASGDEFIGFIDLVVNFEGYDKPIIFDLKTSSVKYEPESVKESQQLCIYSYAAGDKYKTKLAGYIVLQKKIRKIRTKTCTSCKHVTINSSAKTCDNKDAGGERCGQPWSVVTTFDVDVDIIVDEIDPKTEDTVLNLMDDTHSKIKEGHFPQDISSCFNKKFHSRCEFYDLCFSNSMVGLVKKKD